MPEDNLRSAIEALIFVSEKPITLEQLKIALGDLGSENILALIESLKSEYEQSRRGMRIVEVAGGFQMITSPDFAPFLKKLYKERLTEKLSRPALETLAIVAYKQPVSKSDIESLRSVNVDGVMQNLLDKNLIRIAGRKKAPGRPYVFGTTRQFLEHFGLKSLEELPQMEDFSQQAAKVESGEIESISEEKAEELDGTKQIA